MIDINQEKGVFIVGYEPSEPNLALRHSRSKSINVQGDDQSILVDEIPKIEINPKSDSRNKTDNKVFMKKTKEISNESKKNKRLLGGCCGCGETPIDCKIF